MIVVTAATRWEADPLENAVRRVRILRTGMGAKNARAAVKGLDFGECGLSAAGPALTVISSGFAGALQPGVHCGDIVADVREVPLEYVQSARATAEKLGIPLHLGSFLATDKVLKPAEKRELGVSKRALAVDMESGALREWTRAGGGTFMAVRVVLDELDDELPEDAPEEGFAGTLRYAARHWKEIPALMALGYRQKKAMRRLALFLDEWLNSCDIP